MGITERATQRIVAELADGGYLDIERIGRRNRYRVQRARALRHGVEAHRSVGQLIQWLVAKPSNKA